MNRENCEGRKVDKNKSGREKRKRKARTKTR